MGIAESEIGMNERRSELVEELENLFAWSWGKDLKTGRQVLAELGDDPAPHHRRETMFANKAVEIFDRLLATRAEPEPAADAVKHLQEFADMFHFAWGLWAAQDGATPLETEHLKRAMDDVFWSDMILKWSEMVEEGIIANPGLEAQDREIEDVKNRPAWLLPEHTRAAALATVPTVQAAAGDDLDAMLNNIHPNTTASLQFIQPYLTTDPEPYWQAHVSVPTGGLTGFQKHRGTGATRMAAIQDAVRQATRREGRGRENQ